MKSIFQLYFIVLVICILTKKCIEITVFFHLSQPIINKEDKVDIFVPSQEAEPVFFHPYRIASFSVIGTS